VTGPARRAPGAALFALLLVASALAGDAATGEAGAARTRLDQALRSLRDARAPFTQTRTSSLLGAAVTPSRGTLEFRAPRQLRMAFGGPAATTILVRGDTAWIEQREGRQVIRTSARASGAPPLPFLEESVAVLEQSYTLKETGARSLSLTPRAAGVPWRRVDLVLEAKSGMPSRVVVVQADDEEIRLEFGRWRVNAGIPLARFRPIFAAGSKVVDL
jgi:outer membrane lipoprotein-sorting protein